VSGIEVEVFPKGNSDKSFVMYLATFPAYRKACLNVYKSRYGYVRLICSSAQLDKTVKTGIRRQEYTKVGMVRIFGRAYIQLGSWLDALRADSLVLDLNPRGVNIWIFLLIRRLSKKRTIVWGHLYPRSGAGVWTANVRRFMRKLSNGTIVYTPTEKQSAVKEIPGSPVWVAPNSLYRENQLLQAVESGERNQILYVGRFTDAKKVTNLVEAFAESGLAKSGAILNLIGSGPLEQNLIRMVKKFGLDSSVVFSGWVESFDVLKSYYSRAFVSVSPGFAGLGLTQSLGFGVPQVISTNEPHSPEIELADTGGVIWSESSDYRALSLALVEAWNKAAIVPRHDLIEAVVDRYTAEAMADGLHAAMLGYSQKETEAKGRQ
jgi:glycosyltransferase involved in cell wall biosynthesis